MKAASRFTRKWILFFLLFGLSNALYSQQADNWTKEQLMEPAQLAQLLEQGKEPVIISVGPGALIPKSIAIGPLQEKKNAQKLEKELGSLDPHTEVVIYCGCCPFEHCPNIRPAIALLQEKKFSNYRLLNLSRNLKADWLDKGYPKVKL